MDLDDLGMADWAFEIDCRLLLIGNVTLILLVGFAVYLVLTLMF